MTDCICLAVFVCTVIFMCSVVMSSKWKGNLDRLNHGMDYHGRICGADIGVENSPYVFWCRADPLETGTPTGLNLDHPICVPSCPDKSGVSLTCLTEIQHKVFKLEG